MMTSCLTGLDLSKKAKLFNFIISKAAESKQNKQGVSRTLILPLKLLFSAPTKSVKASSMFNQLLHLWRPDIQQGNVDAVIDSSKPYKQSLTLSFSWLMLVKKQAAKQAVTFCLQKQQARIEFKLFSFREGPRLDSFILVFTLDFTNQH